MLCFKQSYYVCEDKFYVVFQDWAFLLIKSTERMDIDRRRIRLKIVAFTVDTTTPRFFTQYSMVTKVLKRPALLCKGWLRKSYLGS